MDLRMVKTRKAIRDAFFEIRKRPTPLEKVKVREVCESAMINPSTFYKHYQDVFDLSERLEDETLSRLMDNYPDKDKLFDDPVAFLAGWRIAIDSSGMISRCSLATGGRRCSGKSKRFCLRNTTSPSSPRTATSATSSSSLAPCAP